MFAVFVGFEHTFDEDLGTESPNPGSVRSVSTSEAPNSTTHLNKNYIFFAKPDGHRVR